MRRETDVVGVVTRYQELMLKSRQRLADRRTIGQRVHYYHTPNGSPSLEQGIERQRDHLRLGP